jgi:hypothetical protein
LEEEGGDVAARAWGQRQTILEEAGKEEEGGDVAAREEGAQQC